MELGRCEAMPAAVAEIEHERRLRIGACRGGNVRRLPGQRIAAVGSDRQRRFDRAAVGECGGNGRFADLPLSDRRLPPVDCSGRQRALERRKQHVVGHIEAKKIFADLAGAEGDGRAAYQPLGRIGNAHDAQRRCMFGDLGEHAECLEVAQRRAHQGGGAAVVAARRRPKQRHGKAGWRGRGGDHPGGPAPATTISDVCTFGLGRFMLAPSSNS